MATDPAFASTVNNGVAVLGTNGVDATNRDGTGAGAAAPVAVLTAGGSGSKIEEIVVKADKQPADSTILLFLYDGTTHHLWDEWDIGAPAAGSATVNSYRESRSFANLVLKSGWSLRAVVTAAPTSGKIRVHAFGGDY
jgi:hypothetical protein